MSRVERLKEKLINREKVIGINLCYAHEENVRQINVPELDFLMFDFEHGAYNLEQVIPLLRLCRDIDLPTMVRVQDAIYNYIAKPVDFGAEAVMLPRTESIRQIEIALESLWYQPIGKKGFVGTVMRTGEEFEHISPNRLLIPQIESPKGVDLLPEMFERYGDKIHAVIIGPYDLSISVGTPLDINSKEVFEQIDRVIKTCDQYKKSCGIYCDSPKIAKRWYEQGMNILWTANEMYYMAQGYSDAMQEMVNA